MAKPRRSTSSLLTPPWFVPDTRPVSEQLKAFRRRKTPFALVVDEYGEVEGLVTLGGYPREEIVGDITDEHDVAMPGVRRQPDGSVNVDGAVPIRDLNRVMDWNLPDEEAATIAGLVIHEAARFRKWDRLRFPRVPIQGIASCAQPHHWPCAFGRYGANAGGQSLDTAFARRGSMDGECVYSARQARPKAID